MLLTKDLIIGKETYSLIVEPYNITNHTRLSVVNSTGTEVCLTKDIADLVLDPLEIVIDMRQEGIDSLIAFIINQGYLTMTGQEATVTSTNQFGDQEQISFPIAQLIIEELENENYYYMSNIPIYSSLND